VYNQVQALLKAMGLWEVRHNFIGFTGRFARTSGVKRGLSGGERKRVSIAVELITYPKILFLDEPTSGLDAYTARVIMTMLRKLAFMGHTVVATIHQPSAKIFQLLDQLSKTKKNFICEYNELNDEDLVVLAEGQIVYAGPAEKVLDYFQDLGYPCPRHRNPAEHFRND